MSSYSRLESVMQKQFLLTVQVQEQDVDLMEVLPAIVRHRFSGTAVTVLDIEEFNSTEHAVAVMKDGVRAARAYYGIKESS